MTSQFAPLLDAPHTTQPTQPTQALQAFGLRSHLAALAQAQARPEAGSWKLGAGHAVTLQDARPAVLRITQGRVWATVDGPHAGPANNRGDVILTAGERLNLLAGQRVVIEPWHIDNPASAPASAPASVVQPVYFSWDAAPLAVAAGWQPGAAAGSRLQAALVCPMRDFALALKMAAQALGRLAWGIAGLGEFLIAGRGRVQPCMESNPP